MARSDETRGARRRLRLGLGLGMLLGLAASVSACSTTQDEAARLQLDSARIRAAELRTVVRTPGHRVDVEHLSLLREPSGSAFVVEVRNPDPQAVGDLPISVGVRAPGRRRLDLNATSSQELSYFDAHLPTLAPGQTVSWVWRTGRSLPRAGRPFALVGGRPSPALTRAGTGHPPVIRARVVAHTSLGLDRSRLSVTLHNTSTVPQYQMPVYAIGHRAGHVVSAGELTVPHLGSHATETLPLPLIGPLAHVQFELTAAATIDR